METSLKNTPENDEAHLVDYLIVLAKYSRSILLVSAAVMLLTYLILLALPNKYTAKASILPPQQNVSLAGQVLDSLAISTSPDSGVARGLSGMPAGMLGKSPGDLYVGMLQGNTIFDRIIDRFKLREVYQGQEY